jgi:hypothetical protein
VERAHIQGGAVISAAGRVSYFALRRLSRVIVGNVRDATEVFLAQMRAVGYSRKTHCFVF